MLRITIKKELEKRLRASTEPLVQEIVAVLDAELEKRAAGSNVPGIGYKELVALLRSYLGDDLILPPAAAPTWIIRTVNKAREQGINKDNVEQIVRGLRRGYPRGPYELGFIVNRAGTHYGYGRRPEGELQGSTGASGENEKQNKPTEMVYTGRRHHDD